MLAQLRPFGPDCIHISTEGPLGLVARAFARRNQLVFTTAYHTRFPEYVRSRICIPLSWTYTFLRWFHSPGNVVMATTNAVLSDLEKWRVGNPVIWPKEMEELPEIYNQADVFVFPSHTDTFGLVLLEVMACGLPVAAFPFTGPIDVIGGSDAGVFDEDLGSAAISAMKIKRSTARAHAKTFSWGSATDIFVSHLVKARGSTDGYHIADNPHKDNHGITRAIAAARNSWAGLMFAFCEESAFRQELL